jgi:hypothetical protein
MFLWNQASPSLTLRFQPRVRGVHWANELDSRCAGRRGMEFPGYGPPKSAKDDSQSTTTLRSPLQRTSLTVAGEFHSPAERPGARFIGRACRSAAPGCSTGLGRLVLRFAADENFNEMQSPISCCLQSAVWTGSGKAKCVTCR